MPWLDRVLKERPANGVSASMVRHMLRDGLCQRWDASDGSTVITRLRKEPDGEVCVVWLAEGTMEPLLELHERICEWAKEQGCDRMRIVGRDGWLRVVPGYRKVATVMEREL
jgi:hypothetical protein